jgi:UDP-N-acetylmuramoylalanine--D-glutamate ligase
MIKNKNIFLGKKILIYGLGLSGISSYNFLINKAEVYLFDDNIKKKINLKLKQKLLSFKEISKINFDKIIVSPGIDILNCKISSVLQKNLSKICTDLDVFYSFYKNESITITGTNGKSTTSKILHEVLLDQKYDVRLIGNIGNPALSEKKITKKTIFVIEISSYQLEYSQILTSKYSEILNITPDHLERHKSLKNYINAKFKLLKSQSNQSIAFVNKYNDLINKKINDNNLKQKIIKVDPLKNNEILDQLENKYFSSSGNKENIAFVIKISEILKLNKKILLRTLNKFKGLKYRQQIIFENKNLVIINDSKSTSFASTENLLKDLKYVYWILCGIPKKGDQFKLSKTHHKNFKIFVFGKNYRQFKKNLNSKNIVKNFKDLNDTLREIFLDIANQPKKRNIILFSPARASFDSFRNFEDRGLYFNKLVNKFLYAKK